MKFGTTELHVLRQLSGEGHKSLQVKTKLCLCVPQNTCDIVNWENGVVLWVNCVREGSTDSLANCYTVQSDGWKWEILSTGCWDMYIYIYIYIVYCLLHYSGNTTSFTFLWLLYMVRYNIFLYYRSLCNFSENLTFLWLLYLVRFNNRTFLFRTILWALLSLITEYS